MSAETTFTVQFGFIELFPYRLVIDSQGRIGQQYMRIDHNIDGAEVSRKVIEPMAWISFD